MPSKKWLGAAAVSLTLLAFGLLVAQRGPAHRPGGTVEEAASFNGTQPKRQADGVPDEQGAMQAYCNVTGPCVACPPASGRKDCDSGFQHPVTCVLATEQEAPLHEVLLEAARMKARQPGERFAAVAPCGADGSAGMSVAMFEWLIVALLGVSLPVMLWRKWGLGRQLLPL